VDGHRSYTKFGRYSPGKSRAAVSRFWSAPRRRT